MARSSPLLELHRAAHAPLRPYGPADAGIALVEGFAPFGLEYAAIRTHAAMLDLPSRGLVRVRGGDRIAFLQRMITQDLRGLAPWSARHAFWLNRKGRIDADLVVLELPANSGLHWLGGADEPCTLLELDAHAAQHTVRTLGAFVIADDVEIDDLSDTTHQLQLHGPAACAVLAAKSSPLAGPTVADLQPGGACAVRIAAAGADHPVLVLRQDVTGEPGLSLLCAAEGALAIYEALSELPLTPTAPDGALAPRTAPADRPARRIGWHAFNVARIEAGTPLYNLDFGPTSLPHETGVLRDRVSFTKGCYLGQELVARMEALGHPKQRLVTLRLEDSPSQPDTGSHIFGTPAPDSPPVGAVTSSAISPMLSGACICFAMVKHASAEPGVRVYVQPQDGLTTIAATVQADLRFWSRND